MQCGDGIRREKEGGTILYQIAPGFVPLSQRENGRRFLPEFLHTILLTVAACACCPECTGGVIIRRLERPGLQISTIVQEYGVKAMMLHILPPCCTCSSSSSKNNCFNQSIISRWSSYLFAFCCCHRTQQQQQQREEFHFHLSSRRLLCFNASIERQRLYAIGKKSPHDLTDVYRNNEIK